MYEQIKTSIVQAMKDKDTLKLQTLRGIKGDADLEHINKGVEINDDLMISVLSRGIKTRKESITEFEKGGRNDLIEKTTKEIELLQSFLPEQMSKEDIMKVIDEVFKKVNPKSEKEMGLIMKEINPLVKGKADMKEVSTLIKEKLSNL